MFTLTGDILHELRSALDLLAWQFVRVSGGEPTDETSYPILGVPPTANTNLAITTWTWFLPGPTASPLILLQLLVCLIVGSRVVTSHASDSTTSATLTLLI